MAPKKNDGPHGISPYAGLRFYDGYGRDAMPESP